MMNGYNFQRPISLIWLFIAFGAYAQTNPDVDASDTSNEPPIEHISPVFDDLTTDLGAKAGENELNVNFGYRRYRDRSSELLTQLEYEVAPMDNLGVEVLVPYTAYFNYQGEEIDRPRNRFEFLQLTAQYTFLRHVERKISAAAAFRSILETQDPRRVDRNFSLATVTYEPYLILAKNWADRYFLLFTGGAQLIHEVEENDRSVEFPVTTAMHYKLGNTDHVAGVEFNKSFADEGFEMYVRPQVIFTFKEDYTLGLSYGIPVELPDEEWHLFVRLAYAFK